MATVNDINGMSSQYAYDPDTHQGVPKYIGAYHMIGDDDYEPQRSNNFELRIFFDDDNPLYTIDGGKKISTAQAEETLTLSVASFPNISVSSNVLDVDYGNTKVHFAGLPNVSTGGTINFNDYIGKATERILAAWYGQVFNPKTQAIGRASVYKKPGMIIETAPDGSACRGWQLQGCWPNQIDYGSYSYGDGSIRQIQLQITYDIAIPLDDIGSALG